MRRIYLDHNASTPPLPAALAAALRAPYGNPGSAHAEGHAADEAIRVARAHVAALINADPTEIVFTSGGTEADNIAILGGIEWKGQSGLLVSAVEHKAVLAPAEALAARGTHVVKIGVTEKGHLPVSALIESFLRHRPALVSVMLVNNETGNRYDLTSITRAIGGRAVVHTDAVAALGKIPINVRELGVDLLSMSAHKIGGLKGIGALYVKGGPDGPVGRQLRPRLMGGGQEGSLRPGTPNVPGIVAFGVAAEVARQRLREGYAGHLQFLLDLLITGLLPALRIVGCPGAPNVVAVDFGRDSREVVAELDRRGIAASSGSACGCKNPEPSHVLAAMDGPRWGAVRFSLGWTTTEEEIREAVRRIKIVPTRA